MMVRDVLDLASSFRQRYGDTPRLFRAPGRVNLIGEHTDYNEGFVLPMALDRGTVVAIAARPGRRLRVWSLNLGDSIELNLDRPGAGRHGHWKDYVEGILCALVGCGAALTGADIALKGDLSIGGGLSSSASLEMALAIALVSISGSPIDKLSLARAGQTAEHIHVGIHSGIMDQFTAVHAVSGHALLLDCRSLEAKPVPLNLHEYTLVVCDSRARHALASSEYNQRRRECEMGVKLLGAVLPKVHALRDVAFYELEANRSVLPEIVLCRCRHVISENERTLKAAEALASGNIAEVGRLMSESHRSLRKDYQVSCRELDLLVETAESQPGVLGARMTGAGFGGCTINLVEQSKVASFRENVSREYRARTRIAPEIFEAKSGDGACEIFI
jgi:galactokinase